MFWHPAGRRIPQCRRSRSAVFRMARPDRARAAAGQAGRRDRPVAEAARARLVGRHVGCRTGGHHGGRRGRHAGIAPGRRCDDRSAGIAERFFGRARIEERSAKQAAAVIAADRAGRQDQYSRQDEKPLHALNLPSNRNRSVATPSNQQLYITPGDVQTQRDVFSHRRHFLATAALKKGYNTLGSLRRLAGW